MEINTAGQGQKSVVGIWDFKWAGQRRRRHRERNIWLNAGRKEGKNGNPEGNPAQAEASKGTGPEAAGIWSIGGPAGTPVGLQRSEAGREEMLTGVRCLAHVDAPCSCCRDLWIPLDSSWRSKSPLEPHTFCKARCSSASSIIKWHENNKGIPYRIAEGIDRGKTSERCGQQKLSPSCRVHTQNSTKPSALSVFLPVRE